ncbi:MAG: hypothetical protein ACR2FY_25840 [Pirellulaceae bacterium]
MSQDAKLYPPPKPYPDAGLPAPPSRSWAPCLIGCGVTGLAVLLICGGTFWYVTANFKNIATNLAASAAKQSVDASEMRAEDKKELNAQIDRVAEGFKKDKINGQELGKIMEGLTKSPLFVVLIVYGVTHEYINRPGQDADVKAEAERTLQRIARGTAEGKIKGEDLEKPFSAISQDPNQPMQPGQPPQTKQQLSDEDLKKFLAELKVLADEKEIPDEPYELNVGKEVKRIVDEAVPGKL